MQEKNVKNAKKLFLKVCFVKNNKYENKYLTLKLRLN